MKRFIHAIFVALLAICGQQAHAATPQNPKADDKAVVTAGNARFTVLTPRMIRMEWSADGKFEDRKTLTFVNRNLDVPKFKVSKKGDRTTVTTDCLTLRYDNDGKMFSDRNLEVRIRNGKKTTLWKPGMEDDGNLLGTCRTLDGADGYDMHSGPLEQGLLSRSGWALVDDSKNHILAPDDSHWKEWVAMRPDGARQDYYLFAYGNDYKQALADYQKVAGKAPLPPKYTFGYWWSRYWQYSDNEFKDLVDKIKSMDIPLDVLIVDMDWHDTFGLKSRNSARDEYGQRIGWTGYTWQKELFPNPSNFLRWVKKENLKTALNLHPASGIQPYEASYKDFVKDYEWSDTTKSVPFHIDEAKWADSYFNTVLGPMEKEGVDFWWLDWQQWKESKFTPGLSNTFWLNHVFFNHAKEKADNERPFIYHRWGGLGSHRYPLGFSGDTFITWETLRFLPYFTATASNVNYGYWGHDIGGHMFKKKPGVTDPELYLRWLQYGVFTPIFKTHSTKDRNIVRYFWAFPEYMFEMRDALKLRYSLAPYIYNAARENYDTGVAMTRPLYYEYPSLEEAYSHPEQFFFGSDIIAAPVGNPVDSISGLAKRKIWFPEGRWYDYASGEMIEGPSEREFEYTLAENPFYVKGGAIVPMNPDKVNSLQAPCDTLVLTFIPGGGGSLRHYEDDGISNDYDKSYAITNVIKNVVANGIKVTVEARKGTYHNAPAVRNYEMRFPATLPPDKVLVDGKEYSYSRFPENGNWTYDGYSLQPVVYTEGLPVNKDVTVELIYNEGNGESADLYGKKGIFNRCKDLTILFKEEQGMHGEGMKMLPEGYLKVSQCPNFILEDPANISAYLKEFNNNMEKLFEVTDNMDIISDCFKARLREQLKKH